VDEIAKLLQTLGKIWELQQYRKIIVAEQTVLLNNIILLQIIVVEQIVLLNSIILLQFATRLLAIRNCNIDARLIKYNNLV